MTGDLTGDLTGNLTGNLPGNLPGNTELRVALVQEAASLDPAVNRARVAQLTPLDTDLVVFPEAFARDFGPAGSDVSAFAEPLDGPFAHQVRTVAKATGSTIVAGMFEASPDPGRPWNTLVVAGAVEASYRKVHLYDSFGYRESDRLSAGESSTRVFTLAGFGVGLMTCYDLRFPEMSRALVDAGAEVLVVPAAWLSGPHKVDHWRILARARAIENTCYVVAAAQPAPRYSGHSMVIDPWGDVIAEAGEAATVISACLSRSVLDECRATNPSLSNRRL